MISEAAPFLSPPSRRDVRGGKRYPQFPSFGDDAHGPPAAHGRLWEGDGGRGARVSCVRPRGRAEAAAANSTFGPSGSLRGSGCRAVSRLAPASPRRAPGYRWGHGPWAPVTAAVATAAPSSLGATVAGACALPPVGNDFSPHLLLQLH